MFVRSRSRSSGHLGEGKHRSFRFCSCLSDDRFASCLAMCTMNPSPGEPGSCVRTYIRCPYRALSCLSGSPSWEGAWCCLLCWSLPRKCCRCMATGGNVSECISPVHRMTSRLSCRTGRFLRLPDWNCVNAWSAGILPTDTSGRAVHDRRCCLRYCYISMRRSHLGLYSSTGCRITHSSVLPLVACAWRTIRKLRLRSMNGKHTVAVRGRRNG